MGDVEDTRDQIIREQLTDTHAHTQHPATCVCQSAEEDGYPLMEMLNPTENPPAALPIRDAAQTIITHLGATNSMWLPSDA